MPRSTDGLLSELTSLLDLDMAFDPSLDTEKLASVRVESEGATKTASSGLQNEIAAAIADYEKTAGGNLGAFDATSGSGAKGTQAQQTIDVKGGGRATGTPGEGTEIARQTDASGLTGPKGAKEQSANDSTESSGMPGAGQEAAAAKTAADLGLVAQGLYTDLVEGAIERSVEAAAEVHAEKLAAARVRLARRENVEMGSDDNEDASGAQEEVTEKQASFNRFL